MVGDISHEGLRELLRAEGVSFQSVKTWKQSADPDYAAKTARIDQLYAIADRETAPAAGDADQTPAATGPEAVLCMDEFGWCCPGSVPCVLLG